MSAVVNVLNMWCMLSACRRLCPGLAFFQNATPHTLDVLNEAAGTFETLRVRVERSVLKSQSVSRNRLGITTANVTCYRVPKSLHPEYTSDYYPFKGQWLQMVTFRSVQCHPGLTYIFNF